jgi:hypothetical protein
LPRSCSKWSTTVCLHRWFSCLMLACRMRKDAHVIDRARRQCLWQHYATLYTRADIASRLMLCHTYWIHSYPSATYLQTLIPFLGQISDEVFSVLHTVIIVGSSIVLTKPSFDAFFFFWLYQNPPNGMAAATILWLDQQTSVPIANLKCLRHIYWRFQFVNCLPISIPLTNHGIIVELASLSRV